MPTTEVHGINFKNAECWQVQPSQLFKVWQDIEPLILKWCDSIQGEMNHYDVMNGVLDGTMQIFAIHTRGVIKLVSITEFVIYPRFKALRLIGLVGENPFVSKKFFPALEQWAKVNGATRLETFSVPKTDRFNEKMGFKYYTSLMRKKIGD